MTPQEKTALVVQTIFDELKGQQSGYLELTIANNDSLNGKIFKSELDDILKNLQDKEHILEILTDQPNKKIIAQIKTDAKTGKKTVVPLMNVPPVMPTKKNYDFAIHVSSGFQNWHSAYQSRVNLKIEDLSDENFHKLFELSTLINNRFQMQGAPKDEFYSDTNYEDYLKFLCNKSILHEYNVRTSDSWNTYKIRYTLNVDKFVSFYSKLQKEFNKRFLRVAPVAPIPKINEKAQQKEALGQDFKIPPIENIKKNNILYEIKYDSFSGKITLNDELLHKTDLNTENDKVFQYLYNHPDKVITKDELKAHFKLKRMKTLSKIIENLKFTGDLRKAFFGRIASDSIKFRKIVTQNDLNALKISSLTINKHL